MDTTGISIFEGAVDDQWEVAAAVAHQEETYCFNARLVKRDGERFWFEADTWPTSVAADADGLRVSFQFGINGACVMFDAPVQSIELKKIETFAAMICCSIPPEVNVTQRRANFRTPVPANAPVTILVWKIPSHWFLRDRPKPSAQLRVELVDLSEGGTCLKVFKTRVNQELVVKGDRLRIEMRFGESEAILDGQVVYCADSAGEDPYRIGVAFQKHENSIEGRRGLSFLNRVIAALQRLALKESATAATT